MQAADQLTTNVVQFPRREPRVLDVAFPPPIEKTPELALILSVLSALTPKQRQKIKSNLRLLHVRNCTDESAARAHLYVGMTL